LSLAPIGDGAFAEATTTLGEVVKDREASEHCRDCPLASASFVDGGNAFAFLSLFTTSRSSTIRSLISDLGIGDSNSSSNVTQRFIVLSSLA
jgi:hypothetical protein